MVIKCGNGEKPGVSPAFFVVDRRARMNAGTREGVLLKKGRGARPRDEYVPSFEFPAFAKASAGRRVPS